MTLPASYRNDRVGDGTTTIFPYTFKIWSAEEMRVVLTDPDTGVVTEPTSGFSVTGVGSDGGNVVFDVAPVADTPIVFIPTTSYSQDQDLVNETQFFQERIEDGLDKLCRQSQLLKEEASRTIRLPESEAGGSGMVLPTAEQRAGQSLTFDTAGNPIASSPSAAPISTAMQPVAAAADLQAAINLLAGGVTAARVLAGDGTNVRLVQVSTGMLDNLSVTTAKIADAAVTTPKIADRNVTGAKLATRIADTNNIVDLRDFLDARHGVGGWTQRTGIGAGTDIGPAMDDALDALRSRGGRGVLLIPPGTWRMVTPPTASKLAGNYVVGLGSMASIIVFDNGTGVMFSCTGAGGYTGGGLRGLSLMLEDTYPTSTSYAISLQGDATYQPDQCEFSDLYITAIGTSYWYNGFYAYGNARTAPQGIRVGMIENVQIFRCRNLGAYFSNLVQWSINNLGTYAGTGTGMDIAFQGGGSANTNSTQFSARRLLCSGALQLYNCIDFDIEGKTTSVYTNATATYGRAWLHSGGALNGSAGASTDWVVKV